MPRLLPRLLAALLFAACGDSASAPDAGLPVDGGPVLPEPKPCAAQKDCGNIVNEMVTDCCIGGKCLPPGNKDAQGKAVTAQVYLDPILKSTLTGSTKPKSMVLRFIYPFKTDGSPLSCAEVMGFDAQTRNCVDQSTRSRLDDNPAINQVFRAVYPLTWTGCSGTECNFGPIPASVPEGTNYLFYGEVWYGERELNNPKGMCAGYTCLEGKTISGNDAHYSITFNANAN